MSEKGYKQHHSLPKRQRRVEKSNQKMTYIRKKRGGEKKLK